MLLVPTFFLACFPLYLLTVMYLGQFVCSHETRSYDAVGYARLQFSLWILCCTLHCVWVTCQINTLTHLHEPSCCTNTFACSNRHRFYHFVYITVLMPGAQCYKLIHHQVCTFFVCTLFDFANIAALVCMLQSGIHTLSLGTLHVGTHMSRLRHPHRSWDTCLFLLFICIALRAIRLDTNAPPCRLWSVPSPTGFPSLLPLSLICE
jgi:hypothetical protein